MVSQVQIYRVVATIPNAKRQKCVRGNVYRDAEEFLAFRQRGAEVRCIWYADKDLKIDLFFKTEERAMQFQTSLRQWNFRRPFFQIEQPIVLPLQAMNENLLTPVLLAEYQPTDSDSPCMTLDDLRGNLSARGTSIEPDTDLGKYQALERPEWLQVGGSRPYRLHLKNQGKGYGHPPALASDENNMLAGSWTFHQFVDGLNMSSQLPIVALEPGEVREEVEIEPGHKRRKVMVNIECCDEQASRVISPMLKPGSEQHGLVFSTFVLVKDPGTFTECLQWKYDDTKAKWKANRELLEAE